MILRNAGSNRPILIVTLSLIFGFLISSCGGSSGGSTPPPPPPPSKTVLTESQSSAFLNRATFGATRESIDALANSNLEDWFTAQFNATPTLLLPYVESLEPLPGQDAIRPPQRVEGWWLNVVQGNDQLRQRVAFALSEIFVTSDRNDFLFNYQAAMANYYDLLVNNAFGNYRDLLEQVTLSPVMGVYLSMLRNQKPDPENNIRPDENYAREIMQLFSIGLVELNQDGSVVTDNSGDPVPTYDQTIIEGFAHVFTGWTFADSQFFRWHGAVLNTYDAMEAWQDFHDKGEKTLLNGFVVPADQTAEQDLQMALDNIFQHDNVPPFISHKLIQRLVTSNPSAAYINRVASVFIDNGSGVRGDLGAVVVAILTDDEAINGYQNNPNTFGKLREPLIRNTHLWRAFNAASTSGTLPFGYPDYVYGQSPQQSPSVFNYFQPEYQPPGDIANAGLFAPEFQLATASNLTGMHNAIMYFTLYSNDGSEPPEETDIVLNIDPLTAIAADHSALLDELDMIFMAGQMTADMKNIIVSYLDTYYDQDNSRAKVIEAASLLLTSNQYVIQK